MAVPMMIAGTLFSMLGQIQQGKAANAQAKYNAAVTEQDRQRGLRTADIAAEDKARDNSRRLSTIRANMGTSGFTLAGSPLAVLSDTSGEMALDERRIRQQGDADSRDLFIKRQGYLAEGKNAQNAGYIGAIGTALSGGSSAAKTFYGA